jgi:hypothetical protein
MQKLQRRFRTGCRYSVEGVSERVRQLKFIGQAKVDGKEVLMFRAVRKAKK